MRYRDFRYQSARSRSLLHHSCFGPRARFNNSAFRTGFQNRNDFAGDALTVARHLPTGPAGMAQIFSPAPILGCDCSCSEGSRIVAGGTAGVVGFARSAYITSTDFRPSQPVPFSHQHHAGELGIDCRYCHSGAETAPRAGLPPTQTCMTCHSQIWTNASMLEPVRKSLADNKPIHGPASRSCRTTSFFATTFTSPRASAAKPAMAASTRWR